MSETLRPVDPERLLAHADFVRSVAIALLRDSHAAEDVVQETFVAALRSGPDRGSLRGWLGGVARNLALLRRRRDLRATAREARVARPEGVPSPVDVLERERLRRRVVAAVLALSEPYRATLLLRYFEDLPPREVARRMGVPPETVRTRTRRGLDRVREALGEQGRGDARATALALAGSAGSRGVGRSPAAVGTGGAAMATAAKVAAGAAAVALLAWVLWPSGDPAAPPGPDTAPASAPAVPPRAARPTEETRAPAPVPARVAGVVVDERGAPFAGVEVRVGGTPVRTGADGRFSLDVAAPGRVALEVAGDPAWEVPDGVPRTADAPAEDLRLVLLRRPVATVEVVLADLDQGERVPAFAVDLHAGDAPPVRVVAEGGTARARIRLPQAADCPVRAVLVEPSPPRSVEARTRASDGEEVRLPLALRRSDVVRGRVVGPDGNPVAGALVFLGSHLRARGDEPAKPFRPERVRDGVRTGADGAYELRGEGTVVTAWHESHSAATCRLADAWRLTLPARGSVRGRVLDGSGAPVPSAPVQLGFDRPKDARHAAATDGLGRFSLEDVESGVALLRWGEGRFTAVRVAPGGATEVELVAGLEEVRLAWPGPGDPPEDAFLIGTGDVAPFVPLKPEGAVLVGRGVPRGAYHLLARGGVVARATIDGPEAAVERGSGTLVVRTRAGAPPNARPRVFVRPAAASPLVDRLAARATTVPAGEDGVSRFERLLPGRYAVGTDRGSADDELRVEVTVTEEGAEVAFDD